MHGPARLAPRENRMEPEIAPEQTSHQTQLMKWKRSAADRLGSYVDNIFTEVTSEHRNIEPFSSAGKRSKK